MSIHTEHVGPCIAERLHKTLPPENSDGWQKLPNGTEILVGVERVYTRSDRTPDPCPVDLGGVQPFVLFRPRPFLRPIP